MRVPPMVSEFFEWRWAPCVGLTGGSLGFVALALLLIPTQFDGAPGASSLRSETALLDRAMMAPQRAMLSASLPRSSAGMGSDTEQARPPSHREPFTPPPSMNEQAAPPPRGFSPIIDRPEPPPAPPPPAPPPPAPVEVVPPQTPPSASPPNVVLQQPQQPDDDGPRREVTVQ
ncbi:MAG: hypothetical protein ABIQ16_16010 [Polyangiaceae bacterium]